MRPSQSVGISVTPALSRTSLFAHIQLVEWMFTGAAIQWPSYLENFCRAAGMTASQFSLVATSSRLPTTPSSPQSWMS